MKRQISGNYYKMRRIFKFFLLLHLIRLHIGTISCTKHIKTVLDYKNNDLTVEAGWHSLYIRG
jgi:hypothetical protein